MKIVPNLGPKARLGYFFVGLALLVAALTAPFLRSPWSYLVGFFGIVVAVEGAAGF